MSIAPFVTLLALSGGLLATARLAQTIKREREGFAGAATATSTDAHDALIETGQERYNPITNLLDLGRNPLVGANPTTQTIAAARKDLQVALGGVDAKYPMQGAAVRTDGIKKNSYTIPSDTKGLRAYDVQMCEKVNVAKCSAFDDPTFAAKCGVCFKPGTDSQAQGHIGGLYLDKEDIDAATMQAQAMGTKRIQYTPSVGTCPPGFFVKDKADCEALAKRLECEQKKTYTITNCSQCYTDGSYTIVDSSVSLADISLLLQFVGTLTVTVAGKTVVTDAGPTTIEKTYSLGVVPEGAPILITVEGQNASIGGLLQGPTVTGVFQLPIAQLMDADLESGIKPRFSGEIRVGGQTVVQLRPARGKTKMTLRMIVPLTFVDTSEDAATKCASGPYLTQEGSAKALVAGTCFAAGNAPGSYSMQCLQEKFTELGCTTQGSGYPRDTATLAALNANGPIGAIADLVYESSLRAATGVSSTGQKLSLEEWNKASVFCTGKTILNPCDAVTITGTMTNECLDSLYKNQGATGRIGATYTSTNRNASLTGGKDRYCTPSGLLSPFGPDGKPQQDAIQRAFQAGGTISDVKTLYDQTHRKANDNTQSDADRARAIQDCYGVALTMPAAAAASSNRSKADTSLKEQYTAVMRDLQYLQGLGLGPDSGNATMNDRLAKKQALDKQVLKPIKAQYVRIKPSKKAVSGDRCLQISQLQVFNSAGQEVAKGKPTTAASTWDLWGTRPESSLAVDGTAKARAFPSIYHDKCDTDGAGQFWMVDLGSEQDLSSIVYYNRTDCCANRADGMPVELLDANKNVVGTTMIQGSSPKITVSFTIFDTQDLSWNNLA